MFAAFDGQYPMNDPSATLFTQVDNSTGWDACEYSTRAWVCKTAHQLLWDRENGGGISRELYVGALSVSFPATWEGSHERASSRLICSKLIARRSSVTKEPQVIGR